MKTNIPLDWLQNGDEQTRTINPPHSVAKRMYPLWVEFCTWALAERDTLVNNNAGTGICWLFFKWLDNQRLSHLPSYEWVRWRIPFDYNVYAWEGRLHSNPEPRFAFLEQELEELKDGKYYFPC